MSETMMSGGLEAHKKVVPVPPSAEKHEKLDVADLGINGIEDLDFKESPQEIRDPLSYAIRASELIDAYRKYLRERTPSNYAKLAEVAADMKGKRGLLFKNQENYRLVNSVMRNQFSIGNAAVDPEYLNEIVPEKEFYEHEFLNPKDPSDKLVYEAIKFFDKERMVRGSMAA